MKSNFFKYTGLCSRRWLFRLVSIFSFVTTINPAAATLLDSAESMPPIEVMSTRVVFDDNKPSASLAIRNNSSIDYLVGLSIEPFAGVGQPAKSSSEDFMCSPAVRIVHPGETFPFRIVRLAETLPDNVESLYVAALKILPSQAALKPEDAAEVKLTLTLAARLKFFFRPKSLSNAFGVEEVRQQLHASCSEGGHLTLRNPSPYWGSFAAASIDGRNLLGDGPKPMIAPKSQFRFPNAACTKQSAFKFSLLSETGIETPAKELHVSP